MSKKKEQSSSKNEVSNKNLEEAAYYRWLNKGCPDNQDLSDWLQAEKELLGKDN